jgi:hypothetical protein
MDYLCLLDGWMDLFFSSLVVWQHLLDQAFCIYQANSVYLLMVSFPWRIDRTYSLVRLVHKQHVARVSAA